MSLQTVEIEAFSGPTSVLIGGGNQPSVVFINQGPAGTGGGATTFTALTDSTTADIPTINVPLATALSLKAPLASPTFTGIVTAPRIEGKCNGLELFCKAGQTITAGQVVYVTGASGTNVIIGLAQANTEVTSSRTIGVSESSLALNGTGYVITEGLMNVSILAPSALVGDPIWLSGTTAGGMLFGAANKPVYPYHIVYLGVVTRKTGNAINEIYVKVQNGFELDEISDVSIVDPLENQVLIRNADKWINRYLVSADINDASSGPSANTLALRDASADLHAANLYSDGNGAGSPLGDGSIYLYDSHLSTYGSIKTNATSLYFYPANPGNGTISISPATNNASLSFSNSAPETYTFPTAGGTLLANTGNLAGLTNLSTARSSLGLGTDASPTFQGLTLTSASLSTSTPNTITQTWNAAGTAFTAVKVNATQGVNGSAASSLLLDLQLDGTSKVSVNKSGLIIGTAAATTPINPTVAPNGITFNGSNGKTYISQPASPNAGMMFWQDNSSQTVMYISGARLAIKNEMVIQWSDNDSNYGGTAYLGRKGPASLRLGLADTTGTTAPVAQTLGVQSWASSTTFNQTGAAFTIAGSQGTGTGAGGSINFQTATPSGTASGIQNPLTTKLTIAASGNVGIGTTTPAEKLSVVGNINATGNLTLGTALTIANGGTGATSASVARSNLEIGTGLENPFVDETTGARTLGLTDASKYIRCTSAITITIPTNAVTAFPINSVIYIRRAGAGAITLSNAGVTVNDSTVGLVPTGGVFALKKIATDTWDFI